MPPFKSTYIFQCEYGYIMLYYSMLYFKLVEGKTPQPKKVEMCAIFVHARRVMFSPPNLDGTYVQCLLRQLGYRALLELPKHALDLFFFVLQCFYMFLLFWKDWGESLELALIGPWRGSFRVQISFEVGG